MVILVESLLFHNQICIFLDDKWKVEKLSRSYPVRDAGPKTTGEALVQHAAILVYLLLTQGHYEGPFISTASMSEA